MQTANWQLPTAIIAALLLGLLLAMGLPTARLFPVGEVGDTAVALRFLPAETAGGTTYRWTSGDSALRLFGLNGAPGSVRVRLTAPDRPTAPLVFSYEGRTLAEVMPPNQWRRYTLLLPAPANPWFTPQLGLNGGQSAPTASDSRRLGVAVSDMQLRPLAGPHPWRLLERALLLVLALGVPLALLSQLIREPG
nr:hypothetical protein [Chloroflexaceae bacterium]